MRTIEIIEGLQILQKYRDKPDQNHGVAAEHDILYAYATDRPVEPDDVKRLVAMGWFQEDADYGDDGEFGADDYLPGEVWAAFV